MSKVLNVFYGADRLPYKDQERQVHYPMVGNSFAGASLVDEIIFYAKDLGTENNVFVGIAKRPDGQRGYQVLTYGYDTELNEPYWTFNVSGWFTEKVGNVFVSLNVYQGGVDIEVDEDSGLAIVSGTPIIQATGSVVLSINYAPVMDNGYGAVPTIDVQEALSLVGSKVDTDYLTANYYNNTTIDGKLLLKADLSYVNGFVKTLEVLMDSSTYVLTFTCKDGTGTTISTQSIDLPLESVVVSGEYDSDTQSIILTLQNGNTISIPVSDLVDGLVDTTTFETAIQGIEDSLGTKANTNEVYTKDEVDDKLDLKADKTTTTSLQNQINDLNSRLTVVEEAIIGVDTLTFTALSYSAIPNVSDNLYPIIQSGGLDTKEIKGNSFVHTQLVENGNFANGTTGFTMTTITASVSNNKATLTFGNPTGSHANFNTTLTIVQGQKYMIFLTLKAVSLNGNTSLSLDFATVGNGFGTVSGYISNMVEGQTYNVGIYRNGLNNVTNETVRLLRTTTYQGGEILELSKVMIANLTKDFGAGNEPTTYDQAVSMYASKGIDITNYVEYTQGTLIDSKPVKLYSRKAILSNLPLRAIARVDLGSLNYILDDYRVYTTDLQNLIKKEAGLMNIACSSFNAVATLVQLTSNNSSMYVSSGGNVSFSNMGYNATTFKQAMNGVYLYFELATPNAQPTQDVITDLVIHEYPITTEVLRSAGSVQDSAVSKKVGSIDLGTLDGWAKSGNKFYVSFPDAKAPTNSSQVANIRCSLYAADTQDNYSNETHDNIVCISVGGAIGIYDSSKASLTAAQFKTAMSGVILNYELATPTEQTATLPTDIEIEKGGSLEVVYDNGYTTPADFVFDCAVYKPLE